MESAEVYLGLCKTRPGNTLGASGSLLVPLSVSWFQQIFPGLLSFSSASQNYLEII